MTLGRRGVLTLAAAAAFGPQPDHAERLAALGLEPVANSPQEFDAILRAELPKWAKVIGDARILKVD